MTADEELLAKANTVLKDTGCVATDLGPDSVGVQGDARFVGPCVYVDFPPDMDWDQIGKISTRIVNEVPGISRVMKNIAVRK